MVVHIVAEPFHALFLRHHRSHQGTESCSNGLVLDLGRQRQGESSELLDTAAVAPGDFEQIALHGVAVIHHTQLRLVAAEAHHGALQGHRGAGHTRGGEDIQQIATGRHGHPATAHAHRERSLAITQCPAEALIRPGEVLLARKSMVHNRRTGSFLTEFRIKIGHHWIFGRLRRGGKDRSFPGHRTHGEAITVREGFIAVRTSSVGKRDLYAVLQSLLAQHDAANGVPDQVPAALLVELGARGLEWRLKSTRWRHRSARQHTRGLCQLHHLLQGHFAFAVRLVLVDDHVRIFIVVVIVLVVLCLVVNQGRVLAGLGGRNSGMLGLDGSNVDGVIVTSYRRGLVHNLTGLYCRSGGSRHTGNGSRSHGQDRLVPKQQIIFVVARSTRLGQLGEALQRRRSHRGGARLRGTHRRAHGLGLVRLGRTNSHRFGLALEQILCLCGLHCGQHRRFVAGVLVLLLGVQEIRRAEVIQLRAGLGRCLSKTHITRHSGRAFQQGRQRLSAAHHVGKLMPVVCGDRHNVVVIGLTAPHHVSQGKQRLGVELVQRLRAADLLHIEGPHQNGACEIGGEKIATIGRKLCDGEVVFAVRRHIAGGQKEVLGPLALVRVARIWRQYHHAALHRRHGQEHMFGMGVPSNLAARLSGCAGGVLGDEASVVCGHVLLADGVGAIHTLCVSQGGDTHATIDVHHRNVLGVGRQRKRADAEVVGGNFLRSALFNRNHIQVRFHRSSESAKMNAIFIIKQKIID